MSALALPNLGGDRSWSPPLQFLAADDGDRERLARLVATGKITTTVDPMAELADELYACRNAGAVDDVDAREAFKHRFLDEADTFGVWVFFPWSGELVRYPEMAEHRSLRTFRNRDLIPDLRWPLLPIRCLTCIDRPQSPNGCRD